jgi:hypothetical protein
VAADSLVWRDGWPAWQPASVILPPATSSAPATTGSSPDLLPMDLPLSMDPLPSPHKGSLSRQQAKKRSNALITTIVVLLAVIAIGLTAVLITMLSRR